jgi:para-nitrobenzyl esterase
MRFTALACGLVLAMSSGLALAQPAPPAPAAATAGHYSTDSTEIGTLLDDPAAKAILVKYVPDMATSPQIDMARAMTLRAVQQFSPDKVTDSILAQIDAELAKLPSKK